MSSDYANGRHPPRRTTLITEPPPSTLSSPRSPVAISELHLISNQLQSPTSPSFVLYWNLLQSPLTVKPPSGPLSKFKPSPYPPTVRSTISTTKIIVSVPNAFIQLQELPSSAFVLHLCFKVAMLVILASVALTLVPSLDFRFFLPCLAFQIWVRFRPVSWHHGHFFIFCLGLTFESLSHQVWVTESTFESVSDPIESSLVNWFKPHVSFYTY